MPEPRCSEWSLNDYEARDFRLDLDIAAAFLKRATTMSLREERTVVLTSPGGGVLATVLGDEARIFVGVGVSRKAGEPEVELDDAHQRSSATEVRS
ncbi:MAG: hypothetical protein H6699_00025 [Myxococcales bacterium]|nr:hypothetical protein [Myxococcales bacterium]